LGAENDAALFVQPAQVMQMRDLPLEECLAVRTTTSLARVAQLAAEAGARYVLVREPTGDVKGVQLTSVANWMAEVSPSTTAEEIPLVGSVQVELGTSVWEALTMMANSTAAVLLVREPDEGTCRIVQRNLVEMSAGVDAAGVGGRTAGYLS
jgi:predicted transcriptional regulator